MTDVNVLTSVGAAEKRALRIANRGIKAEKAQYPYMMYMENVYKVISFDFPRSLACDVSFYDGAKMTRQLHRQRKFSCTRKKNIEVLLISTQFIRPPCDIRFTAMCIVIVT